MTIAIPTHGLLRRGPQADAIQGVLRITEESFVHASENLSQAVEILRGTEVLFARLDGALGDETGETLSRLISETVGKVEVVRADFDHFLQQSEALRIAVRSVRVEVNELDRVVRTTSNVSINARIQGNGLVPPRPQVNSFIERLAHMSSEAEAILQEVKEAMVGIGHDMAAMDQAMQELRQELMMQVLPALSRFAAIVQKVQDGRAEMTRMGGELAGQMQMVFREVSRLYMALQTGDSTRQRLERVKEVLSTAQATSAKAAQRDSGLEAVLVDVARALIGAARTDAEREASVSGEALELVRVRADQAVQSARGFYFAQVGRRQDGAAMKGEPDALEPSLQRVRLQLSLMRSRADELQGRLDIILKHEATIRQIARQVRLSGLNAVLICAKLGEEGRSLRELAQWLRTLTDESDAIVLRLQVNLDDTRQRTSAAGQVAVDRLEHALSGFISNAETLTEMMAQIDTVVSDAARGFDAAGKDLPLRLGNAVGRMNTFRDALVDLDGLAETLTMRRALLIGPVAPFGAGTEDAAILARVRGRYTMQQERVVHDGVLRALDQMGGGFMEPDTVTPEEPPVAEDSLDDILF